MANMLSASLIRDTTLTDPEENTPIRQLLEAQRYPKK